MVDDAVCCANLGAESCIGVDVSRSLWNIARATHATERIGLNHQRRAKRLADGFGLLQRRVHHSLGRAAEALAMIAMR